MRHNRVIMIAAVGNSGQLGLDGKLPWHNARDLNFFYKTTCYNVVLCGRNTAETLPVLHNRELWVAKRGNSPEYYIQLFNDRYPENKYPEKSLFVIGGATIYNVWLPYAERAYITFIDYDGNADTYMPNLWK